MKKVNFLGCLALLLIGVSGEAYARTTVFTSGSHTNLIKIRRAKVYLVAVNDNGKTGKKIGCGDSLVPVTRIIKPTGSPLKAALEELLAIPHDYNQQLGNYWQGEKLKVKSISLRAGLATIHITGKGPYVAGVCDEPRIKSQIEETAKQFSTVRRIKVFINGRPLAAAIR
ncbi:MAG: GerMN domain-containing protein [Pyrinomonadaceae bacterium]